MRPELATRRKSRRSSKNRPDPVLSKERAGGTPLHCGAQNGHKDVAELLLANQADVNAKDGNYGDTPLQCGAQNGHKDVVELLLASQAASTLTTGSAKLLRSERRAVVNGTWRNYCWRTRATATPTTKLRDAVTLGCEGWLQGCGELLLASNADVHAKNDEGETALHCMARNGYEDVVELLRQHGSNESANPDITVHDRLASLDSFRKAAEGSNTILIWFSARTSTDGRLCTIGR